MADEAVEDATLISDPSVWLPGVVVKNVDELEGLRGVMSLWVVIGHVVLTLPPLGNAIRQDLWNVYAVDVFIILSGFVIFFMLARSREGYKAYLTKRFFRIFPLYLVVLAASIVCLEYFAEALRVAPQGVATVSRLHLIEAASYRFPAQLVAHLTLLQGVIPEHLIPESAYTIVGQAWSVSVEWQFYLLAPFLFVALSNFRSFRSWAVLLLVIVITGLWARVTGQGFIGHHWPMFGLGFASFFVYQRSATITIPRVALAAIVLVVLFSILAPRYICPVGIWLAVLVSVIMTQRTPNRVNPIAALLNSRLVTGIGHISYSIYMVHVLVLAVMLHWLGPLGLTPAWYACSLLVSVVLGSLALASVTHRFIELPGQRFGKRVVRQSGGSSLRVRRHPRNPWS